jgi:site-specific recombinase XerD
MLPCQNIVFMNDKPKKLEDLTSEFKVYMTGVRRLADSTVQYHRWYWNNFASYLLARKIELVDAAVCKDYLFFLLADKDLKTLRPYERTLLRFMRDLIEFQETGKVLRAKEIPASLGGPIGEVMMDYIADRISQRFAPRTIVYYRYSLSKLLDYLTQHNVQSIKEVNEVHLLMYFKSFKSENWSIASHAITMIKGFFNFLYRQQILDIDYSKIIPKSGYNSHTKRPSSYTADEIKKLLDSIDRASATGKRNYAIILLAAKLGLRASDIVKLQFNNIDWTQNIIKLTQYKTCRPLELPLLPEVGNAIIDYLRYGRPESNSPYIFLISHSPYTELLASSLTSNVRRIFACADIDTRHKKSGPHALRHSLAGLLLEKQTTLPVISEILGHKSSETTRCYLRIDLKSLRHCALEVPMVSGSFYTQKGGYFYA